MALAREQFLAVPGGRVLTMTYGDGSGIPLLALHGGPGMPSYYLASLAELADDRTVVLFDQLGCGRSERPDDPSLWTVERAIAEVEAVRQALRLETVHLLGHSWGGFLALAYARDHQENIASLVLSSPLVSVSEWLQDAADLIKQLPAATRNTIAVHEAEGAFDHPDYREATMKFYRRFFCKLDPWPAELVQTFDEMGQQPYNVMWGPSEFTQTGNLRGLDLTATLRELEVPSLWLCGSQDEVSPARLWRYAVAAGGRAHVFVGGTHCVHLESPAEYLRHVRAFLRSPDSRR